MPKLTMNSLVTKLYDGLLPTVSKSKCNKAWDNFKKWMEENDQENVTEETLLAYTMWLHEAGYAPTTLRSVVSMLKKKP